MRRKQQTLAASGFERYRKRNWREAFLAEMAAVVPWRPVVEEALCDSRVTREFVGIDLGREPAPNETVICKFRHLLERNKLGIVLLKAGNDHPHRSRIKITKRDAGLGRPGPSGSYRRDSPACPEREGLHQSPLPPPRSGEEPEPAGSDRCARQTLRRPTTDC
jgi:hypothetical protein